MSHSYATSLRNLIALSMMFMAVSVTAQSTEIPNNRQTSTVNTSQILTYLPQLLGFSEPMSYLIMLQASDELRPSGGFLKILVYVTLNQGQVTNLQTIEIGQAEIEGLEAWEWQNNGSPILPPQPIQDYMGLGNWVIRDANWWLDFRDTANQVQWFWEQAGYEPVDAVIAVNDSALMNILNRIGGIELNDGQILTGEDLRAFVISRFYEGDRVADQVGTTDSLAQAFLTKVLELPPIRYPFLLSIGLREAQNNDIMVSFNDENLAAVFHEFGLDGALSFDKAIDYLYLVESNVSYTKASPMIQHQLDYTVDINSEGLIQSELLVTLTNNYSSEQEVPGFPSFYYLGSRWVEQTRNFYRDYGYYGGYTRLVLSPNANLIMPDNESITWQFVQRQTPALVIGRYHGLNAGESEISKIKWEQYQPDIVSNGIYNLYIQRQSGLPEYAINLSISYPDCWAIISSSEVVTLATSNSMHWNKFVDQDSNFRVLFNIQQGC